MQPPARKVMVVTAHPDDSEFGCAGTVALWTSQGTEVTYVICTNGDKGSSDRSMTSERLAVIREREQRRAAETLGVKNVVFLGFRDGSLEDDHLRREAIVRQIRRYRPELVITLDPYQPWRRLHNHRDHRICGILALDACFPYARDHLSYPEHLEMGLEPHKVGTVYLTGSERPDVWVDVTTTFERKLAALRCHESQVGQWPRDDFENQLRAWARSQGEAKGYQLAEAFRCIPFMT